MGDTCPLYCRFCGARLRRDVVGHYCPTRNCQWQYGVDGCEEGHAPPFIIAEAGSSHGGPLAAAVQLIEAAQDAGCNAVKFQFWSDSDRASDRLHLAPPHRLSDQYRLPEGWLPFLSSSAHARGLGFLCTVDLPEDIPRVAPYVDRFKIASWGATDVGFISQHVTYQKPLVISTGLCSALDVRYLKAVLSAMGVSVPLWFLHCVSAYPAPLDDLNLAAIRACGLDGFSDHTGCVETGAWAVLAGARVLEVHVRLPETPPTNPDFPHSLPPDELRRYCTQARLAARAFGDGIKRPMPSEMPNLRHRYLQR